MAKQILFDSDGRQKLTAGMQTLAKAVSSTLGPSGKNVVIDKSFAGPVSTKDGISVSKEIELPDPFENMGAKILNEVASKTNDNVGDGTTTAIVLASSMIEEGRKFVASGVQAQSIRRGMDLAAKAVEDVVLGLAKKVEGYDQIRNVAYISSNSDNQIADLLAEAMESVTNDGVITIEENKGTETYLEVVKGLQFDKGFCSPYFITDPANLNTEYEDVHILFFEKKITAVHELVPLLEKVVPTGKPLVIVAENVEAEALAALVINKLQGVLKVVAVKSPGFGDRRKSLMEDMAILTGGVFISEDIGWVSTRSSSNISAAPRRSLSTRRRPSLSTALGSRRPSMSVSTRSTSRWSRPPRPMTRRNSPSVRPSSAAALPFSTLVVTPSLR